MNLSLILKRLWRWYIIIPGLILSAALAVGVWFLVGPTYERTATLLLVPGVATVPDEAGNPYFYLSGLTQAADVVVRAVGSENARRDIEQNFEGVEVDVSRDPTTAGPVIVIVVDGRNDADTTAALELTVQRTKTDLLELQVSDRVARSDQIQVRPVTIDDHSTLRQRTRLVATAGASGLTATMVAFFAALAQVAAQRTKRRLKWQRPKRDGVVIQWDDWATPHADAGTTLAPDKTTAGAGRTAAGAGRLESS